MVGRFIGTVIRAFHLYQGLLINILFRQVKGAGIRQLVIQLDRITADYRNDNLLQLPLQVRNRNG